MGKALSSVFGGGTPKIKKSDIAPPEVKKPAPMPDEEDLKRKAAIAQAKKPSSGRDSTILSDYESLG